jgi:hypothetical protein
MRPRPTAPPGLASSTAEAAARKAIKALNEQETDPDVTWRLARVERVTPAPTLILDDYEDFEVSDVGS